LRGAEPPEKYLWQSKIGYRREAGTLEGNGLDGSPKPSGVRTPEGFFLAIERRWWLGV